MINFSVGPVQANESVRAIGAQQVPYFRTAEFSQVMLDNETMIKSFTFAPEGSRVVFLTGSGTASMESIVLNLFDERDNVLIVNGGSFGQRFSDLCDLYHVPHTDIRLEQGHGITPDDLASYENGTYTGFLVNLNETSTGVLYDIHLISDFCRRNNIFLVVDAISSFLADPIDMEASAIGVMCAGSQKALACPPGVSIVVLSPQALERLENYPPRCMYLDLRDALKNMERGQTPFTPAVSILLQINERLHQIENSGGVHKENERVASLAKYFRKHIKDLPFEIASDSLPNAVTPLRPTTASAYKIFLTLKDEYGIWVVPNGGKQKDTLFRVGHIGDLTDADYDQLIDAFRDMQRRNLI